MPGERRKSSNIIKKILCGQCKLQVEEDDGRIQCDKCSKTFHDICTTLDKRQFDEMVQNRNDEYICHFCNESGGDVKQELNAIKTQLAKLNQLDELQTTMHFMSTKFDDIIKGINENKRKIEAVQKENKNLKKEIADLKTSVKMLNDQRVKNDCVINGLECEEDADAVDTLLKFLGDFNIQIEANNIDEAFFLKSKKEYNNVANTELNKKKKKKTMIVKFSNKATKQIVMSVKSKLKEKDNKSVFINDFLSRETLSLLNHAKSLQKVGYRRIYSLAGRVYVKRSELSNPRIIKTFEEVDNLLLEATTNSTRRSMRRDNIINDDTSDNEVHSPFLSPA